MGVRIARDWMTGCEICHKDFCICRCASCGRDVANCECCERCHELECICMLCDSCGEFAVASLVAATEDGLDERSFCEACLERNQK